MDFHLPCSFTGGYFLQLGVLGGGESAGTAEWSIGIFAGPWGVTYRTPVTRVVQSSSWNVLFKVNLTFQVNPKMAV